MSENVGNQMIKQSKAANVVRKLGSRERILRSAEEMFATRGFDGASVRSIALAAEVPTALINYHFESKAGLYWALFEVRSPTIVDQRLAGLELAAMEHDLDRRLELTIKALVVPMFKLRASEGNAWFIRILSREVTDPSANSRGIIAHFFDPIAHEFIENLKTCLPDHSDQQLHWAYNAMLGVMVYIVSDTGRIARLSDGLCDPDDYEDASAQIVSMLLPATKLGGTIPKEEK